MKLRNLMLTIGVVGLLAPAALMAADTTPAAEAPAATVPATEAPTEKAADNTAAPKEGAKDKEAEKPAAKTKPKSSSLCARSTGSILRPSAKNGCTASTLPMRSFTQDELQSTGEIDLANALRKLDPSIH